MTETRTLQFESPRTLQLLYANDLKLLKSLEDSLGVKVTTREGWVKLEGEPSRIDKAQHVFDQLEKARQKGVNIQKHEFNYALDSVNEAREEDLGDHGTIHGATELCRGNPETRHRFWNRTGWHGQNLSCGSDGRGRLKKGTSHAHHFDETRRGSRRSSGISAGGT